MSVRYQKHSYSHCAGFVLHHTTGFGANESTLDYPHTTIYPMLIYFLHGKGNIKIEGNRYDLSDGDAILLNPGELFHCTVDDNVYHERIVLYFKESVFHTLPFDTSGLFEPFYSRPKGTGNLVPALVMKNTGLSAKLEQLLTKITQQDSNSQMLSFCNVLECLALLDKADLPLQAQREPQSHVDNILAYINAHFAESINIEEIAGTLGMNKSYLSHLFKDHVGMSLWNYVILRRLHCFNDLLRKGDSIEQACYDVGFQNYSNFFRLYKKHMGITPLQYKKQLQK